MIDNLIVRQEVESACKEKYEFDKSTDSTLNDIQQIGDELHQNESNSHFSYKFILESGYDWQSHLERISDFLVFGENVWWEKNEFGVDFFDYSGIPQNSDLHPEVHHFRSSSNPSITKELNEQWCSIVKNKICIPGYEIFVGNEDELVQRIPTTYLGEKLFDHSP